jgi:hypothetical protein
VRLRDREPATRLSKLAEDVEDSCGQEVRFGSRGESGRVRDCEIEVAQRAAITCHRERGSEREMRLPHRCARRLGETKRGARLVERDVVP